MKTPEFLRHLDVDDLFILSSLLEKPKLSALAKNLLVTAPAISHRLQKYRIHIPEFDMIHRKDSFELSEDTKKFCVKAKQALNALMP